MTIELTQEIYTQLEDLAQQQSTSVNELLQDMIHEYNENLEDYKIAREAYNEYLASGKKTIPADEVFKELGIV